MKYVCNVCGWVYDEAEGLPEQNVAPGTKFEDLPEDFACPLCGVGKDQFSKEQFIRKEKSQEIFSWLFVYLVLIFFTALHSPSFFVEPSFTQARTFVGWYLPEERPERVFLFLVVETYL